MSKNLWYAVKSFTCLWSTSHLESRANIEIIVSYKSYDLHTITAGIEFWPPLILRHDVRCVQWFLLETILTSLPWIKAHDSIMVKMSNAKNNSWIQ